jgi:hypothetical protein
MPVPYTFTFQPKHRTTILNTLGLRSRPREASRLISNLEHAVALYKGWDAFERRQPPESAVKKAVKQFYRQVDELQKTLRELDFGTRRALAPFLANSRAPSRPLLSAEKPPELSRFHRLLSLLHRRLEAVAGICGEYLLYKVETPPRRGPKIRTAQEALAVAVADALSACLPAIRIVSTADGMYAQVVGACLEAAGVRATGDLHRIVMSAVRAYRRPYRARGGKIPSR